MFLTKSKTFIIGWVAAVLGFIMNAIFIAQSAIGLDNIGLCIILFTIVIYMLLTPLTYQQQKFSKLSSKMNPELQAIQKKYKGKNNDQAAMAKMNEETQAVYAKYGVNPMGSCVQLLIQMPILFALYRVIWNVPAYVDKVYAAFGTLANNLLSTSGAEEFLKTAAKSLNVAFPEMTENRIVDVLYKFKPADWANLAKQFPKLSDTITGTQSQIDKMNYFLGLNIADSPMNIITGGFKSGAFLLVIGAVLIPVLAAFTQWLNTKLMTSFTDTPGDKKNDGSTADAMASSMKTMNTMMPLMSAFFCLTLPVGMGLYWIIGAVVRSIQQLVINKRLEKMNVDEIMAKNMEKLNKKREKEGLTPQKMNSNARISTRNIDPQSLKPSPRRDLQKKAADIKVDESQTKATSNAKPGSLAAKAAMVQEYNAKHKK